MDNISPHISYLEGVRTDSGLNNIPPSQALINMRAVAINVFEPLREWFGNPIYISSFYRSPLVNDAVKGAYNSQHTKGEAIDLSAKNVKDNRKLFLFIHNNLEYDQLIWEKGNTDHPNWIHVSLKVNGKNRKQVIYNI